MEDKKPKTQYRISIPISIVIMAFATVCDLLSLIPLVGDIVSPIFWGIMAAYFWTKGMGFLNGRRFAVAAVSFVAEMIPAVQELPFILAGAIAVLFMIRVEDKTGISLVKPMSKGVTPARLEKNPFNGQKGTRLPNKRPQA